MKRHRYCDECGNICDEERCPICGRKTRPCINKEAQDAGFLDEKKYEQPQNSTYQKRQDAQKERKEQEAIFDDSSHQASKPKKHPLHLHMEAGKHPYYEHVRPKAPANSIMAMFRIVAIAIMVAVISFIAFSASHMMGLGSGDDEYEYMDTDALYHPSDEAISIHPDLVEEDKQVKLSCSVKEAKDDQPSILTFQNDTAYLAGVNITHEGNIVDYVLLPAQSKLHYAVDEPGMKTCTYEHVDAYSLEGISKAKLSYRLEEEQKGGFVTTKIIVKEALKPTQLETLMRYLYEEMIARNVLDSTTIRITADEGDTTLFIANLDYFRGTIDFERMDADFDMEPIEILN